jgi:enterochelin esterase-like enzyme
MPAPSRRTAGALLALSPLWPGMSFASSLPQATAGRIERIERFASRHVAARPIDIWLPEGWRADRRCAVLYMHDGQMLFDPRSTWNGQSWAVDAALSRLMRAGTVPETIVVGIHNIGPERYAEFFPQKALALVADEATRREYVERAQNGRSLADAYLRFMVEELKPEIDRRFATRPEREATFVMGSSMGGLSSLYALCEHPQVFGGAAALSTHWIGRPSAWGPARARNAQFPLALLAYLARHLPPPGRHRLWTDRGDDALDALYAPAQTMVAELLRDRGWTDANARVRVFNGSGHNERDWAARVDEPLTFLLGA